MSEKEENLSKIKYSKSLGFKEMNSLLHSLGKLLLFEVLWHIDL